MKRLLKKKGLHQAVMFHDVRWGAMHEGRFLWVLLNSGSCGAYAFNHDPETLEGVHSYRQPALYFPTPGGTFAGESLPGEMTWARAYIARRVLWMDIGKGEVVKLPPAVRDAWWEGTTREWPFMAADMGISHETLMAHYLSNHVAVAYGDIFGEMVALSRELGIGVGHLRESTMNQIAIVTAYGVGRAVAHALLANGYDVVLAGRRREQLDETAALGANLGGATLIVPTDMARAVAALFRATRDRFVLDLLFNNAGIAARGARGTDRRRMAGGRRREPHRRAQEAFRLMKSAASARRSGSSTIKSFRRILGLQTGAYTATRARHHRAHPLDVARRPSVRRRVQPSTSGTRTRR